MKWFKHITDSLDDPDIGSSIELFGPPAYLVFFRTLEIMAREYDEDSPGINTFLYSFFRKKYPLSPKKLATILEYFNQTGRIISKIYTKNGSEYISLECPKLKDLTENKSTKRVQKFREKKQSETVSETLHETQTKRTEVEVEVDKEKEKDKREKTFRNQLKIFHNNPYTTDMLKEFFEYWTEPNKSKTKMRFELEKTWDLKKRLARWDKFNGKYHKESADFGDHNVEWTDEQKADAIKEQERLINEARSKK